MLKRCQNRSFHVLLRVVASNKCCNQGSSSDTDDYSAERTNPFSTLQLSPEKPPRFDQLAPGPAKRIQSLPVLAPKKNVKEKVHHSHRPELLIRPLLLRKD